MTCKDCVRYNVCKACDCNDEEEIYCNQFIDKNNFVEVVRCKDCVFYDIAKYDNGTKQVCRLFKRQMQDTDYCSYAKRGERDNDKL